MTRKRLTQLYPLLLPVRKWQRKKLFYLKMYLSKCNYANVKSPEQIKKLAEKTEKILYVNQCEIAYKLSDNISVKEITAPEKVSISDYKFHMEEEVRKCRKKEDKLIGLYVE